MADFPPHGAFMTTRWSLVIRAGKEGEEEGALADICRDYWYPLYAYVRRRGFPEHDAQDLTQGFFQEILAGGMLGRASEDHGRFRSYLLGAVGNFLANERRRNGAAKRGGHAVTVSLDEEAHGEERYSREPADGVTPETQFERNWAFALLERVFVRLGDEYEAAGRAPLFATLRPYLAGKDGQEGYAALGAELGMSQGAVAVAIHRMRRRYGELLRDEIARTVADAAEVEEEIAYLLTVVAR